MKALALGIELALTVALLTYAGFWLDKRFSLTLFIIVLPMLALAGGITRIYLAYKSEINRQDK